MISSLLLLCAVTTSPAPGSIYDFTMKSIDGKETPLKKYEGKVLLIVNVASKCGNTPQYKELEAAYRKYRKSGLVVLGFPANEFGKQEPGTDAQIKAFCTENYDVTFPMFSKIVVKGEGVHPLYTWLTESTVGKKDISWNFEKFLIGRDGKIIKRFGPRIQPNSAVLVTEIEKALAPSK